VFFSLFPANRSGQFDQLGHLKPDFLLNNLQQSDIGGAQLARLNQRTAHRPEFELSWRTRRETRLTKTLGLPTFSNAFFASSAFKAFSLCKRAFPSDLFKQAD